MLAGDPLPATGPVLVSSPASASDSFSDDGTDAAKPSGAAAPVVHRVAEPVAPASPNAASLALATPATVKKVALETSASPQPSDPIAGAKASVLTQTIPATAPAADTVESAPAATASPLPGDADVLGQIAKALEADKPSPGQQMVIQLDPPELGRVRVVLQARGDQIRGILKADDPETFAQLRRETHALVQTLCRQGLDVRSIDVLPTQQAQWQLQQQSYSQAQDGWGGRQQSSPQQDSPTPWASPVAEAGADGRGIRVRGFDQHVGMKGEPT
jgi:flagellar hook-length control protein FliK